MSAVFGGLVALGVLLVAALVALGLSRRAAAVRAEQVVRVCHEVRGPLTAAHLALDLLERRGAATDAVADELRRAARALEALTGDRPPAGAGEVVDVGALVRRQADGWRAAAARRGGDLVLRGEMAGALVLADPVRLARAVANLVDNAVEHGAGTVEVGVRVDDARVVVDVCDEGGGLPAPVAAIAARARAGRGTRGRGLAIVADTAAQHGGRLATAPSASGARLVLELPQWHADDRRAAEAQGR